MTSALDPWAGAENIGVPVRGRDYIAQFPTEVSEQLLVHGTRGWSAVTFKFGDHAMIVLNPNHDAGRQKVTLAEELAHLVMGHPRRRSTAPRASAPTTARWRGSVRSGRSDGHALWPALRARAKWSACLNDGAKVRGIREVRELSDQPCWPSSDVSQETARAVASLPTAWSAPHRAALCD